MDASTNAAAVGEKSKRHRNWWKIGFFVVLLAFEVTRELLVITLDPSAVPNANALVFSGDGYVKAEGSWKRIDGGGSLVPGTVAIECQRETGQCLEASTTIHDEYVYAPDLSYFNATFTPESVSYVNDVPDCARYSVRIDLEMNKVFAVRQKKQETTNPACAALENRIEMQIADGYETYSSRDPLKGHFVPLLQLVKVVVD